MQLGCQLSQQVVVTKTVLDPHKNVAGCSMLSEAYLQVRDIQESDLWKNVTFGLSQFCFIRLGININTVLWPDCYQHLIIA